MKGYRKRKDGSVTDGVKAEKRPRGATERPSMAIRRLVQACEEVFKGPGTVPLPREVSSLRTILDKMRAEDVGLRTDLSFLDRRGRSAPCEEPPPVITWTTIHHCHNFSVCVFLLPSGSVMPLHDHPGMTVFSKLLLGSMHVKAYDWARQSDQSDQPDSPNHPRLAELKVDAEFHAPCDACVLYPNAGGNMHTFTAVTSCAILDVLGPPYTDERECTYYREMPCPVTREREGDRRFALLERMDGDPDALKFIPYEGPPILDK